MEIALTVAKREAKIAKWFSDYSKQLLDYVGSKISDFADAEEPRAGRLSIGKKQ